MEQNKPSGKHYGIILAATILGYGAMIGLSKYNALRFQNGKVYEQSMPEYNAPCVNPPLNEKRALRSLKTQLRNSLKNVEDLLEE